MKTCVFITGTNAVGKSSLAWNIIDHFGGVSRVADNVTFTKAGDVALAGKYVQRPYGGVDRLNSTAKLAEAVERGFAECDIMICEGSYLDTFGLNLTNALFKGQKQLVVSLYAEPEVILARLNGRSGDKSRRYEFLFKKQHRCMVAARKFQSIGVPVLQFDTGKVETQEIADAVLKALNI